MTIQNLNARIMLAIQTAITKADLFTILDISEAIKADGGPFVRHREVHEIARPILDALIGSNTAIYAQYTFEDIDVNTKDGVKGARLYYPKHKDPNSYVGRAKAASAPKVTIATPKVFVQHPKSTSAHKRFAGAKLEVLVDSSRSDGSMEIPVKVIVASGLLGKPVTVVNHPNSISIKVDTNSTRIMKQGFRLTFNTLDESNIDNTPIRFAAFSDTIVISDSSNKSSTTTTQDKIIKLFQDRFNGCVNGLTANSDLRNEFPNLDSLDYAEILMDIEDEFKIVRHFDNINVDKIRTINDIAKSIDG